MCLASSSCVCRRRGRATTPCTSPSCECSTPLVRKVVSNPRLDKCPRLFVLLPAAADTRPVPGKPSRLNGMMDRGKALVAVKWRLYLLCEGRAADAPHFVEGTSPLEMGGRAADAPHFVEGTSPLEMDVPKEALVKAAPYLKLCASLLAVAVKLTTGVALPSFLSDVPGADAAAYDDAVAGAAEHLSAAAEAVDAAAPVAERVDALAAQLSVRAACVRAPGVFVLVCVCVCVLC